MPTGISGTEYTPEVFEVVSRTTWLRSVLVTVTLALGTAEPEGSRMDPSIVPEMSWPIAGRAANEAAAAKTHKTFLRGESIRNLPVTILAATTRWWAMGWTLALQWPFF